ncbi:MAG: RNA exonuclease 3 [Icmadophila ericetorum]|nr:RNA exonuclease 3 [Icmadophila ericetorum]
MFSSLGLFNKIPCPQESQCKLLNCIFSHDESIVAEKIPSKSAKSASSGNAERESLDLHDSELPQKRQRISGGLQDRGFDSERDAIRKHLASSPSSQSIPSSNNADRESRTTSLLKSALRAISPPPSKNRQEILKSSTTQNGSLTTSKRSKQTPGDTGQPNTIVTECLNPRMLIKPPTSHDTRLKLVTMMHEQYTRLNDEINSSKDPLDHALQLTPQEMTTQVLDEEEKLAKESGAVYTNLIKLRIGALKKFKVETWKAERLKYIADHSAVQPPEKLSRSPVVIDTGLKSSEEVALLSKLVANQDDLSKHGYVTVPASEEEIEQARQGVTTINGWEQCDRCRSRFQVFPGRRQEDGALASGGKCHHHYGKLLRPTKEKSDTGLKENLYSCCSQTVGSPGCTVTEHHVFKISEAKRLALVLPFERTPQRTLESDGAICFDCEMGYTTLGMELIRLTAVSFPDGKEVLDVLVRPAGEILDLNSRFSGVWPRHYQSVIPYESEFSHTVKSDDAETTERPLLLVDSPAKARQLFFEKITPKTPLIGHALENDLNVMRMVHPTIIDTVLLYPHPRGLPIRHGLRMLVKKYLNRDIQTGGSEGHDSKEDARAAGDLVRLKVGETWKKMKREGWTVEDGVFIPPKPDSVPETADDQSRETEGLKRKHS